MESSLENSTSPTTHSRRGFLRLLSSAGVGFLGLRSVFANSQSARDEAAEKENIRWFKKSFGKKAESVISGTPFTIDFLAAVALQETGYFWSALRGKGLTETEILAHCVGDTLDFPSRSKDAFPKDKTELLAAKDGEKMFRIAREALESIGKHNEAYQKVVDKYPDKFCHGFGIFQYDLQFFLINPDFFLEKRWLEFDECLRLFVKDELVIAQRKAGYEDKKELTDTELVYVAIAYNRGRVEFERGFKQGHLNQTTGKYYGEHLDEYLRLSKTVTVE